LGAPGHIALLGDSIFDNGYYVPGEPSVADQVRAALPSGWETTLLAVDGASASDVRAQLERVGAEVTHLFLSAGGNDALNESSILTEGVASVAEAEHVVARAQARFRREYEELVSSILAVGKPAVLCTVYDAIPNLGEPARVALTAFNDVILRTAFRNHTPVIDLRLVCDEDSDYSVVSEIEPSAHGGAKIAQVVADVATSHDFTSRRAVVYP